MPNNIKLTGEFQPNLYLDFHQGTIYSNKNAESFVDLKHSITTMNNSLDNGYYFYINSVEYYKPKFTFYYYDDEKFGEIEITRDQESITLNIPDDKRLIPIPMNPEFTLLNDENGYNIKIFNNVHVIEILKTIINNCKSEIHEIDQNPYQFNMGDGEYGGIYPDDWWPMDLPDVMTPELLEEIMMADGIKQMKEQKFFPFYIYLYKVKVVNGVIETNNGKVEPYNVIAFGTYPIEEGWYAEWSMDTFEGQEDADSGRVFCMPLYAPSLTKNKLVQPSKEIDNRIEGQLHTILYPQRIRVGKDGLKTEKSIVLCSDPRLFNFYSYKTIPHPDPNYSDEYVQLVYAPEGEDHTTYDFSKEYSIAQKCFFQIGRDITKFLVLAPGSIVTFTTVIHEETLADGKTENVLYWVVKNPGQFIELDGKKILDTYFASDENSTIQHYNGKDRKYIDYTYIDTTTGIFVSKTLVSDINQKIDKYNKKWTDSKHTNVKGKLYLYIYTDSGDFDENFTNYYHRISFYINDDNYYDLGDEKLWDNL